MVLSKYFESKITTELQIISEVAEKIQANCPLHHILIFAGRKIKIFFFQKSYSSDLIANFSLGAS